VTERSEKKARAYTVREAARRAIEELATVEHLVDEHKGEPDIRQAAHEAVMALGDLEGLADSYLTGDPGAPVSITRVLHDLWETAVDAIDDLEAQLRALDLTLAAQRAKGEV
jgi:hypothetical protein